MIVYFDTSALLKLLIDEEGRDVAADAWDGADVRVTSLVTYAEARAALAAARRDHRLGARSASSARRLLDERWEELHRVTVTDAIVRRAGDLADRAALRGYDAIHLASALEAAGEGEALVVTWDAALASAAHGAGTAVAPAL